MTAGGEISAAAIPGVWRPKLTPHRDPRGLFVECFKAHELAHGAARAMTVAQVNYSTSSRGTIRGIHYFAGEGGQVKYVTCVHGEVLDVVVDVRLGSPTFGRWEAVRMSSADPAAVQIPLGLGHALMALSDNATLLYLCDTPYVPGLEKAIDPLDPELGLPWPAGMRLTLSSRDRAAPALREAGAQGLLPRYPGIK